MRRLFWRLIAWDQERTTRASLQRQRDLDELATWFAQLHDKHKE